MCFFFFDKILLIWVSNIFVLIDSFDIIFIFFIYMYCILGMYGIFGFDVGVFLVFLIVIIGFILDFIVDYYVVVRVVCVFLFLVYVMNRGILVEGFMSMMVGFWGVVYGIMIYVGNIGVIGLIKV